MRNTCSSSDNDNDADDKYQQCKDMDVKYRSPYVVVKPGGDVSVVNSATTDDHNDKSMKLKKNHERKNVKGTYSSTLSTKYDADTPDSSWICVFCKRGPHKKGLGDLYGPYIASLDIYKYRTENNIAIGESVKNKIVGGMPADTNTSLVRPLAPDAMKSEIQLPQGFEPLLGDMKRPLQNGLANEPQSMEIWFHEDCAIWAPNLFLVGSKLVGLENAIWNSTQHVCVYCNKSGAIVCCLERECKETAHPICAQESNWLLNESKLWAYCIKHY
uniref:PHD-like zinc-binding protein n=1 Tax=Musca domestica TaxID=7370 RepID=T1PAD1_MUSDO